ncbi:AraC family transcriptional regulator [Oscillospiraceae bacterium HV4-5-C5C]|nr:AraC family transcriptional regulator [Oscillospiraceae bacterium]MDD4367883.1 AraC family transcriptional regulator [Oscillospiraceae bacterium]NJP40639.1 AraC family transcriptional regulator [Oscillospiraceae bacterium HV4-5-C5C]
MDWERYDHSGIQFRADGWICRVLNIVREQFHRAVPAHSHGAGSYELHYIPSGRGTVMLNGTARALSRGMLYVTGPGVVHEQWSDPQDPMAEDCLYLHFEQAPLSQPGAGDARADSLTARFLRQQVWLGQDQEQLDPLFTRLFTELRDRRPGFEVQGETLIRQILIGAVRNYAGAQASQPENKPGYKIVVVSRPESPDRSAGRAGSGTGTGSGSGTQAGTAAAPALPPRLDPANEQILLMEECFLYEYDKLTLADLSRRLGRSERQTQRLIRQQYGQSFRDMKQAARLSAARVLLQSTQLSIAEIADRVGYTSSEHFSAAFRQANGQSARAFRRSFKASAPIARSAAPESEQRVTVGQTTVAQPTDGQATDGQTTAAQTTVAQATAAQPTDTQTTEAKPTGR